MDFRNHQISLPENPISKFPKMQKTRKTIVIKRDSEGKRIATME
ncbi:MAG: hypothetical protein QF443_05005 [Dehalococcoidia bacterium]|nr:hypothetical protein [Dehalococcoidia bacterium]